MFVIIDGENKKIISVLAITLVFHFRTDGEMKDGNTLWLKILLSQLKLKARIIKELWVERYLILNEDC